MDYVNQFGLVFSRHLAMKPIGGKVPEQKIKDKIKIRNEAQHKMWLPFLFSRYVKDASRNILPVLDFVSGEAITLHVYV